ncbi:hypothetical protein SUGI_0107660 [Cryptomeria japonica]|uniref:E3 ubiquitin-protein ligase IPI1 n=1 Tax=Cryptomeria japonica TaxID=3369 RepID=UPI002408A7A4|nr:E3 ubiquitin-protein ligase IPI1 [Cryptomeria japonica]GLJ09375.1 hypothetical protein SUGI_0107660 [Cryptomeria japonica]
MESGSRDKQSQAVFLSSSSISCSVCLEAVADRGERSIAKLKCGHHFHLDCIGSAFNAKGAMQCPNCRHVEHGQWLYANGCRPHEEFIVEDLTNNDYLYDVQYSEMPFGFPWCPYQGSFSRLSVSLEDAEPPSSYPDLIVNFLYGEHSNASNGAHLCPYLAVHGISRARQMPVAINNVGSSNTSGDPGSHHRNGASTIGDTFSSHTFSASEAHHRNWHASNAFPSNNNMPSTEDPALPTLLSHDRLGLPRMDSERLQRTGSSMPSGYAVRGFYPRAIHGRPPPTVTNEFVHSHSHIQGPGGGQLYHPPSSVSSMYGGLGHGRRSRPRDPLVSSRRVIQNIPAEQARVQGASAYPMSRNQEADSVGWHQNNPFYGWQREGFPPVPWVPVDQDSQRWGWFHPGQNPQNMPTESTNRNYHRHSYFSADGGPQVRPGIPSENPYQRHACPRFPPSFP